MQRANEVSIQWRDQLLHNGKPCAAGNLVTNASWEHVWLNEGFTVFLERKILGRLYGVATEQFHAAAGFLCLQETVQDIGPSHNFTKLVPDLSGGIDPDDASSHIPYEKGFYFLYYLQELVGGAQAFEPFLREYVQRYKFSTVSSDEFRAFFNDYFRSCPAMQSIDWDTWLYSPGMPPVENKYDTSLTKAATDLAVRWHTADIMRLGIGVPEGASSADVAGWSADQLCAFLVQLTAFSVSSRLHRNTTRRLNDLYGLDAMKNPEIRCAWLKLCIGAEDAAVLDATSEFLKVQGRMKFLRPLYKALKSSTIGKQLVVDLFQEVRAGYHPIAEKMVAADLGLD